MSRACQFCPEKANHWQAHNPTQSLTRNTSPKLVLLLQEVAFPFDPGIYILEQKKHLECKTYMLELGKLERVDLRKIWPSESADFTPWLSQESNLQLLADAVSMSLSLIETEKMIGTFRADIIAKDILTDQFVLIENQFDKTDHKHLGQIITYTAGISAETIIWIAESFTEEHRSAITWLNDATNESLKFFAIELELWRIGESHLAPKFNIVAQPNGWNKAVKNAVKKNKNGGKAGRLSNALDYALKWVPWADAGFPTDKCPWKNPYEMKKRKPKIETEAQARSILATQKLTNP